MATASQKHGAPPPGTAVAHRPKLLAELAAKYGVDPDKMFSTLKATVFKGDGKTEPTTEQVMALLVVAREYNLNPWTKEIYAFPQNGGIIPVIGVDGWVRMMNEHPQFVSQTFRYPDHEDEEIPAWIECVIVRKDRTDATVVREYYAECKRNTPPWNSHPRRMLRHKALIQAARIAFGFSGVYDPDEAERIRDAIDVTPEPRKKPATQAPRAVEPDQEALATADQVTLIIDACSEHEVAQQDVLTRYGVQELGQLHFDQVAEVLAWIKGTG